MTASPQAALARGLREYPGRDLWLLQADTELPPGTRMRLEAGFAAGVFDVLSPLDGAGLPANDNPQCDAVAWAEGEHAVFPTSRWSAQCSLWRAQAAQRWLAAEATLLQPPLRLGLLPCLQVGPGLGGELPDEPLWTWLRQRQRNAEATATFASAVTRPAVLHILHSWGGGVRRFAADLAQRDQSRHHLFLLPQGREHYPPFGRRLCLHLDLQAAPVREWELAEAIADSSESSPQVQEILRELIDEWGIGALLVSSLIGHSLEVLRTGLPTAFCTHDLYPFWPLLQDQRELLPAFDVAGLQQAIDAAGADFLFPNRDAGYWQALHHAAAKTLREHAVQLVAPSDFARDRLLSVCPALADLSWHRIAHDAPDWPAPPPTQPGKEALRVLVPGRLLGGKGERLLQALLPSLPQDVQLILLGGGREALPFATHAQVQVHGDYDARQLPALVATIKPDLALLPTTLPETWSYTLSEMQALRLPLLCADRGALRERLAAVAPQCLFDPDDIAALAARLAALRDDPSLLASLRVAAPDPGATGMAIRWTQVLPAVLKPLRLTAASDTRIQRCRQLALRKDLQSRFDELAARAGALEADAEAKGHWGLRLSEQVQSLQHRETELLQQAAAATTELTTRQQEAQALSRRLELARAQLAEAEVARSALAQQCAQLEGQLAQLQEQLARVEKELADAHGYYSRDTADLIRQRDVALEQRNRLQAELLDLRRSSSWRVTAPIRVLKRTSQDLGLMIGYRSAQARQLWHRGWRSLQARGIRGTWKRLHDYYGESLPEPVIRLPQKESVAASQIELPQCLAPVASIIVPVHNHLDYTLACLHALATSGERTTFEVIVVDDASSDESTEVLPALANLRYLRNARNLGFVGTCNAGATLARGQFLVFLNNDTVVQTGWLDALLQTFETHPDTGLAGSKLVYPDGRLQEAGGIVFSDGTGWNYGRFEDPAHPIYNNVREVDYCSGAAIAIRRELFEQFEGFDRLYAPAYFEDTDLAMKVRQQGLKVRYQPASVVVHYEGISSGTDTRVGVKANQISNHVKFSERWQPVLASEHPAFGTDIERAARRGLHRNVLVLDACTPTPDRDSGSVRMRALLQILVDEGCRVRFFPENRAHDGDYTRALQQLGVECWWHPWLGDVPHWLEQMGPGLDLVIASRHYVLEPLLALLRRHAPQARIVFDTVDLHFLREQRAAELANDAAALRAAARTREIELGLMRNCDATWVVSSEEQRLLQELLPQSRIEIVSNIHEERGAGPDFEQRQGLLFVGSYRHPPNVDAALWLAKEIFPRIRERLPDAVLNLVGGDAPSEVTALGQLPGVRFHGYVPDLQPLLDGARIALAPLRYGAGVKGKVNQSLAHGQPVVATTCAVEGMHLVDGEDVLVADDAAAFAEAVVRLHADAELWRRLSAGGLDNTRKHFSAAAARAVVRTHLSELPRR